MADQKLTDKSELLVPHEDDLMHVVDVSDTTHDPTGTSKRMKLSSWITTFLSYFNIDEVVDTSFEGKDGFVPMVDEFLGLTPEPVLRLTNVPKFTDLVRGNAIINGGITHIEDLTYNVWATSYVVNGMLFDVAVSDNVTLSDGDPTDPRIDVIVLRVNALTNPAGVTVEVLEGTPAASPVKPTVDLVTEVEVSFKLVLANETTDPDVTTELVFDEATGEPGEWDNTHLIAGGNLTDTTDPYNGSTSHLTTPAATSGYVEWENLTNITFDSENHLIFAMQGAWNNAGRLNIQLTDSSSGDYWLMGLQVRNLREYGFIRQVAGWHLVSIPLADFTQNGTATTYDTLTLSLVNTNELYFDWINIQGGLDAPSTDIPVLEVVAGTGITVDSTDPQRPIVNSDSIAKTEVTLSAAEIQSLGTVPIEVIPSPGVGKIIKIISAVAAMEYGTTVFDFAGGGLNQSLILGQHKSSYQFNSYGGVINHSSSINMVLYVSTGVGFGAPIAPDNSAINVFTGGGDATQGDSTIKLFITYEVLDL